MDLKKCFKRWKLALNLLLDNKQVSRTVCRWEEKIWGKEEKYMCGRNNEDNLLDILMKICK